MHYVWHWWFVRWHSITNGIDEFYEMSYALRMTLIGLLNTVDLNGKVNIDIGGKMHIDIGGM